MTNSRADKSQTFEEVVNLPEILNWFSKQSDSKDAWNKAQLLAALRLIHHFFGEKWYGIVLQRIDEPSILNERRYLRFVKSSQVHLLAQTFWNGGPEELVRITRLGEALKILGFAVEDANLSSKLEELRSDSFAKAYFELKIALIYARRSFKVRLLKPPKGLKSPDMLISQAEIETFIECKKRKSESDSSLAAKVGGVIDRLRDAREQIVSVGKHGIVYIEVEDNLDYSSPALRAYTQAVIATLPELPEVSCVVLSWEKIEDRDEAVYLVTDARGIPNPVSLCPFPKEQWCNPAALAPLSPSSIVDLEPCPPLST